MARPTKQAKKTTKQVAKAPKVTLAPRERLAPGAKRPLALPVKVSTHAPIRPVRLRPHARPERTPA